MISKGQVTGNENVKVVFRGYLRDLRQSKTEMIVEFILTSRKMRIIFPSFFAFHKTERQYVQFACCS